MKKTLSVLLTVIGFYFMWLGLYALVGPVLLPFSFPEPYNVYLYTAVSTLPLGLGIRLLAMFGLSKKERLKKLLKDTLVVLSLVVLLAFITKVSMLLRSRA
ncbi:MAG: hypothetical protein Q8S24_07060 [Eubacteriales bacterium]|nr:hypothetical protein [Eubacteriales bacterium]